MVNKTFKLILDQDMFPKGDIFNDGNGYKFKVVSKPRRDWYALLFQHLTFGYYQAPWYYNVEPYE